MATNDLPQRIPDQWRLKGDLELAEGTSDAQLRDPASDWFQRSQPPVERTPPPRDGGLNADYLVQTSRNEDVLHRLQARLTAQLNSSDEQQPR